MNPYLTEKELLKKGLKIFSLSEFIRAFKISGTKAKYFLETYTEKGLILRLKKGLYVLKSNLPREEIIANLIYKPSYISFEYALAFYNIIPEMSYSITNATTKPTRIFDIDGKSFSYNTIKKEAYTGYELIKKNSESFLIATREKALADYLYFVSLGKKTLNERLYLSELNMKKLREYAKLFKRPSLLDLVDNL